MNALKLRPITYVFTHTHTTMNSANSIREFHFNFCVFNKNLKSYAKYSITIVYNVINNLTIL